MKTPKAKLLVTALAGLAVQTFAQDYELRLSAIAHGGGVSTGGPYHLSATIDQPIAHSAIGGGACKVAAGFWNVALVQQMLAKGIQRKRPWS